jgi:hypothetical protein
MGAHRVLWPRVSCGRQRVQPLSGARLPGSLSPRSSTECTWGEMIGIATRAGARWKLTLHLTV